MTDDIDSETHLNEELRVWIWDGALVLIIISVEGDNYCDKSIVG